MKKINIENIKKIIVHGGVFHADDVLAVALLRNLGCEAPVGRVFKAPEKVEEGTLVLDIGGEYDGISRFDHHQNDCPIRYNGVKYAAFGLLVKALGICEEQGFESFDEKFVCGVDARDNGQFDLAAEYPSPVGDTINEFVPSWDESRSMDEAFEEAVQFAQGILRREFSRRRSAAKARSIVLEAAEKAENGIVVLPQFCPWQDALSTRAEEFKAVVYPALRGGYNAQVVPSKTVKRAFPLDWLSNKPREATFVHQARFLCATSTEEEAIRLAAFVEEDDQ